ncbi:MAG: hypothetical protein QGG42_11835 [Phycisphaerae bacterium]|nr:hypothetical protein [Phycisphaerae bacterium]
MANHVDSKLSDPSVSRSEGNAAPLMYVGALLVIIIVLLAVLLSRERRRRVAAEQQVLILRRDNQNLRQAIGAIGAFQSKAPATQPGIRH